MQKSIPYESYVAAVTATFQPGRIESISIPIPLLKAVGKLKDSLSAWVSELGLSFSDLEAALKSKRVFKLLNAVKFNVTKLFNAVSAASHLIPKGLGKVIHSLSDTKVLKSLRSGGEAVDKFLADHPVLRTMTSLAIAGLLTWLWLNACFVGDFTYDFDLENVGLALAGKATVAELFSESNLELMALSLLGVSTGLSFPWIGNSLIELVIAIVFSGAKQLKLKPLVSALKTGIEKVRL